jgi:hypothetical protein
LKSGSLSFQLPEKQVKIAALSINHFKRSFSMQILNNLLEKLTISAKRTHGITFA